MSDSPNFYQKALIVFFSASMVVLSAHQLVRYGAKNKSGSDLKQRAEVLKQQLLGEIDVAKASVSPEYLRQTVESDKLLPADETPRSVPIRKSISESVGGSVGKVISNAEKAIQPTEQENKVQ
jgi:hypothetical protein